jgi:hypothetical protein
MKTKLLDKKLLFARFLLELVYISWFKNQFIKRFVPVGRTAVLDEVSIHFLYHIVINVNELAGFHGNWYKCHAPGVLNYCH